MKQSRKRPLTPRLKVVIEELKASILAHYPDATFELLYGDEPPGYRLVPIIDVEDTGDVLDVVSDRLLELQIEEGLPLYVSPSRPIERTQAMTLKLLKQHPELRRFVAP